MVSSSNPDPRVRHFGFLLLENYSMIAFANAVEVLRMANLTSRQTLYTWSVCAAEGGAAQASNGLGVCGACQPEDLDRCDAVFVCGGVEVQKAISDNLIKDLRRRAARGQTLGALCTGQGRSLLPLT
jgi:transcriptional regulator GlxA family with amidase domain